MSNRRELVRPAEAFGPRCRWHRIQIGPHPVEMLFALHRVLAWTVQHVGFTRALVPPGRARYRMEQVTPDHVALMCGEAPVDLLNDGLFVGVYPTPAAAELGIKAFFERVPAQRRAS